MMENSRRQRESDWTHRALRVQGTLAQLPRRRAVHLAVAALLVLQQPVALWAATITVTGFDSTVADEGVCTLREAITAANTNIASGATPGECPAGDVGPDTVELTGDVTLTVVDNTTTGANGLPVVSSEVTVDGGGFTIERSGAAPSFRFFELATGDTLTLETVTLRGGDAVAGSGGGAILNGGGALYVNDSTLTANNVGASALAHGGAVSTRLSSGTASVTITGSTLSNNTARYGGALSSVAGGTAVITATIANSTFSGNASVSGAGLRVGAILGRARFGGAHTLVMTNSTVSGNVSVGAGALLVQDSATATVFNSTIAGNTGFGAQANVTMTGSILGNNSAGNCQVVSTDGGGNFADDATCPGGFGTLTGLDPTLADNGGLTETHALLAGSSAIDAAGACGLATDQRGATRVAACDSGAYEFGGILPGGCEDPGSVDYGGFTAADCASSVVKAKNQTQLDAYLADFGVGGGTKPKHLNMLFNPPSGDVEIISPCRIKVLGASKLIDLSGGNVCIYGRAGVTVGAGTPAAGSAIDAGTGEILMVSEENKVQTKPGIDFTAGDMELEASTTAEIGSGSTVTVAGPLVITSGGTSSTSHALIQPGSTLMVDDLTMTAPNQVRLRDNANVAVTNDLTMTATGGTSSSAAEIQQGGVVVIGGNLDLSGFSTQIGGGADVTVTGTATLAASGSATASDAEILGSATLTAADVSQTAEHKAVLSGGATIDAGAGNAEIDAPACVISGTVIAGTTSGSCLTP